MFMPVATDPSSQCDSRRHWVWRIFPPLAQLQPDGSRRHRKGALKSPLADLMQKNGSVVTTGSATSYRFRTRENRFLTLAFLISFRSATSSGATPSGTIFVAAPTATSIPSTGRCLRVCRKRVGKPTGTGQLRSSPIPARRSYDGGGAEWCLQRRRPGIRNREPATASCPGRETILRWAYQKDLGQSLIKLEKAHLQVAEPYDKKRQRQRRLSGG